MSKCIEIKTRFEGQSGILFPGHKLVVDDAQADILIGAGYAEEVEPAAPEDAEGEKPAE